LENWNELPNKAFDLDRRFPNHRNAGKDHEAF